MPDTSVFYRRSLFSEGADKMSPHKNWISDPRSTEITWQLEKRLKYEALVAHGGMAHNDTIAKLGQVNEVLTGDTRG